MDRILIDGLRELGVHGVLPEEQTRPQPFEVDVELDVDLDRPRASRRPRRHRRLRRGVRGGQPRRELRALPRCSSGSRRASPRCARSTTRVHRVDGHRAQAAPAGAGDGRPRRRLASSADVAGRRPSARTSGIGSNLGDRLGVPPARGRRAGGDRRRRGRRGVAVYETDPVGGPSRPTT